MTPYGSKGEIMEEKDKELTKEELIKKQEESMSWITKEELEEQERKYQEAIDLLVRFV